MVSILVDHLADLVIEAMPIQPLPFSGRKYQDIINARREMVYNTSSCDTNRILNHCQMLENFYKEIQSIGHDNLDGLAFRAIRLINGSTHPCDHIYAIHFAGNVLYQIALAVKDQHPEWSDCVINQLDTIERLS